MEVTFETEKSDYAVYILWFCFYKNIKWRIVISSLIAFYVGADVSVKSFTGSWSSFLITSLITWFLIFFGGACLPYFTHIIRFNRRSKNLNFPVKATIRAYSEGLSVENAQGNYFVKWKEIKQLQTSPKYIYIKSLQSSFLIPKKYFVSAAASSALFNKINKGFRSHRFFYPKPNYAWGLLCLVPLIGFFNGIVMIVKGISKYKDIKYTVIGIGGVLLTIGLYGSLFYQMKFGTAFDSADKEMAVDNLNTLVKSIEFYKLQNNHYPDSLQEVNEGGLAVISDNMDKSDMFSFKNVKLYNYKKVGNKYILFSSGFDGIPYTKDDVYPTINVSDTSKFGLLKPTYIRYGSH